MARLEDLESVIAASDPLEIAAPRPRAPRPSSGSTEGNQDLKHLEVEGLGLRALARRLNVSDAAILKKRRERSPEDFSNWCRGPKSRGQGIPDPDGWGWEFREGRYFPRTVDASDR